MESHINGGAGDVREVYPCPRCGDPLCSGNHTGDDVSEHDDEPESREDGEPQGSHDMSDDAEALASAGHGTDEDYGYYGGGDE